MILVFKKLCTLFLSVIHELDPFTNDDYYLQFTMPSIMGRQEDNLCDAPPDFLNLLKTDVDYKKNKIFIFKLINISYQRLNIVIKELDLARNDYKVDSNINIIDIKNEKDLFKLRNYLEVFHKDLKKLEVVDDHILVGFFKFDQSAFKINIAPGFRNLLGIVENKLPKLASESLDEIENAIAQIVQKIHAEPQNTKETVNYLRNLSEIEIEFIDLFAMVDYAHDLFILMKDFGVDAGEERKELYMDTEDAANRSNEYFIEKSSERHILVTLLSEFISNDFHQILKLSEQIGVEIENSKFLDVNSDGLVIKAELAELQIQLKTHLQKAQELRGYQREYKIDPIAFQEISEVLGSVEMRQNLWNDYEEWNAFKEKITYTLFFDINMEELIDVNTKILKNVSKYEKFLPPSNLLKNLKDSVTETKLKIPVIGYLRNPYIRGRHWNAIESLLQRKIVGQENIKIKTLELCSAFDEEVSNQLMLVSAQASGEYQLETMLKSIENIWKETELTLVPHGDERDVYILVDEELVTVLEDTNINLSTIYASRFIDPIKPKVIEWIQNMNQFSKSLEEWMDCQFLWMYFETIFASADIQRQLPEEAKLFSIVDRNYKDIVRKAKKIALAFPVMTDVKVYNTMKENNAHLSLINKCIESYLEVKRIAFPRFYFLSNDELLEILRQTRNPHAVQVHLPKIFDAVNRLEFGVKEYDEKNNPVLLTNDIIAMISSEGERLTLGKGLKARGNTEDWLTKVEEAMFLAGKRSMKFCHQCFFSKNRIEWFQDHINQNVLTVSIEQWTADVEMVLMGEDDKPLKLKELQILYSKYLVDLANLTRKEISSLLRKVLCALITVDVHSKNSIDILIDCKVTKRLDFNWLKMFRFYYEKSTDVMWSKMASATLPYYYEYIGASGVLVLTPLTDKCYLCLMGAMQMNLGGSPAGPAGTGKTETTKNLAKQLAKQCIVFNCSDGLDYKMMGKFFSGLAQCGAWCCFDEFNRINIEVLSVIAQQLITIQTAKKANVKRFMFEGREIRLIPSCVVFITMNPGYAGRTELPDNLKALFRPMSMMIPDYSLISEVILYSEGFEQPQSLAQKMVYMYKLCSEQLSQQNHYDFGMRAVKSVLVMAGTLKRSSPNQQEDVTLICALRDSNIPKFLPEDVILFEGILSDLFPNVVLPIARNDDLANDLIQVFEKDNNQPTDYAILKCSQLFDTVNVRWGIMVLGKAASGKSVVLNSLIQSITNLTFLKRAIFAPVDAVTLNPKAVSSNELYGYVNSLTLEWRDGLLGKMVRDAVNNKEDHFQYIICDGPVDAEWIENLNSVLDDNKLFCLANSERIKLTPWVRMVFEVEDLAQASPATVSRCGMVYLDESQLGWFPILQSWRANISKMLSEDNTNFLYGLHNKYFLLILKKASELEISILKQATVSKVNMYCSLMHSLLKGIDTKEIVEYIQDILSKCFIWCILWALASNFNKEAKDKLEIFVRIIMEKEKDIKFPNSNLWDCKIDFEKNCWILWDTLVKPFEFSQDKKFFELQVSTSDTTKYEYISTLLFLQNRAVMFVGESGIGKSLLAEGMIKKMSASNYIPILLYFSAKTSSLKTQQAIENKMIKRRKNELDAPPGKKLIAFVDDINMPTPDKYNSQPPIELLRLLADLGGLYDRDLLIWKKYLNLNIAAACAPPGGGRNPMTSRLTRHFSILQLPKPGYDSLQKIFGSILNGFLEDFNQVIKSQGDALTHACIDIYNETSLNLLPSPEKSHYIFNLRDLSKCIQGLLQSEGSIYQTENQILRLFVHETTRVFHDRLVNNIDKSLFKSLLKKVCVKNFGSAVVKENDVILFGDFMIYGQNRKERIYKEITDVKKLDDVMNTYLNELVETQGGEKIVLFGEALENAVRISRILRVDRGNALLIGLAGMGKQSLTKLASYVNLFQCYQIDIISNYDINSFHDDIRILYRKAGVSNLCMVFLIADSQIVEEEFLEDIGNILTSGEVENLFEGDAFDKLFVELQQAGLDDSSTSREGMYRTFLSRVKDNLHIVLAMSPIGEAFRRRCRMFPALLNYCTINWFTDWPVEALFSVAFNFLSDITHLMTDETPKLAEACVFIHQNCETLSEKFLEETRRHNYITPSSYMGLLKLFEDLLIRQVANIDREINRLANGLNTIFETNKMIAVMQTDLEILTPQLDKQATAMKELVKKLEEDTAAADKVKIAVGKDEAIAKDKAQMCKIIADDAATDLEIAMPALRDAENALNMLSKADINELKAFATPPLLVQFVMEAVCILFGAKPSWASAKTLMADVNFVFKMVKFDKEHISESTVKKLKRYVEDKDFVPSKIEKVSKVAKSVSLWVIAMEKFAKIYKVVEPKIKKRDDANAELEGIMKILRQKQQELTAIEQKIEHLKENLENKTDEFRKVQDSVDIAMARINRAHRLAAALVEEETRWKGTTKGLLRSKKEVVGNTIIAAACVSYLGAFTTLYRKEITEKFANKIQSLGILCLENFNLVYFLGEAYEIRNWNLSGLPNDDFSIENAIFVTKAIRWPLMIDPQEQANNWIQNLERKNGLVVLRITEKNPSRKIERCIQTGCPLLFENIGEVLDSALTPVLQKKIMMFEGRLLIKYGEKMIEYNKSFKLYLTTKLSNPHYIPEVCINVTLINFQVTTGGLTDQLLAQIVAIEQPEIEIRRNDLIVNIDNDKTQLAALEDKVLKLLAAAGKKILDDEEVVETLNNAKETSIITACRIADAEIIEKTITENREKYRSLSAYGAVLYSVISRLGEMNPMYQYSLKYFFHIFCDVVKGKGDKTVLDVRLRDLKHRTLNAIYNKISRSLFGNDKAVFRFLLASAIELQDRACSDEEFAFLTGIDQVEFGIPKPDNLLIAETSWQSCVFLDKHFTIFKGLIYDMQNPFAITIGNSAWVCNHLNQIIAIDASNGGASHDSAVWNKSEVQQFLESSYEQECSFRILGDSGYPLLLWLLTPYRGATDGSGEMRFNNILAKARCQVERVIGILKGRWRCLCSDRKLRYPPATVANIVNVCAALHNICLHYKMNIDYNVENIITEERAMHVSSAPSTSNSDRRAKQLRDEIKNSL